MLDTSKCVCFHQRWYRFQLLLRFCVDGQKRLKNARCGREKVWKTGQKILPFPTQNGYVWTGLKFRSTTRKDSLITLHVLLYYHLVRGSFFFVHCKAKDTVQLSVSHSKSLSFLIGLLDHRGSLPRTSQVGRYPQLLCLLNTS